MIRLTPVLEQWFATAVGPDEPHIDIPRDDLPKLLADVQHDLAGFLTALRPWALDIRADLADPLVAALDRRLQVSAPLGM
ncbi:hypothetical protein [Paractinoplanes atraurantiacus]|uniref:Uncharacterized protein n=1 Tax=Paractinoplanes atraurantiacus TaxID=1036182 RepID=A0A285KG04_9ACTN|nr:hypothetical protein [Actinoplanes atraurantiacus]SNY71552.1 hypothetical protein SAMN05421748_14053 [Actinoplanes atraurantiacus]